jgi:hypothetical protein
VKRGAKAAPGAAAVLALLAAAWLLAGCSAIRVAYDNADTFVRWRATSYLDVSGEASDELDERIDAFHAWHRANAVPQYAKLAAETARRLADGLSPQDIDWGYDSFVAQTRESLAAAAERIAPMLDRLSPQQLAYMEQRFVEDNRKFARENMRGGEQERRRKRMKRTQERLEDWVGRLSEAQIERVRQYAEQTPLFDELRDRDRKRLQGEFLAIVRSREAQKRLAEATAQWDRGRDPAYASASAAFRKEYFAMLLDVDKMLSAEQRAKLVARFQGFAEDFAALARPSGADKPAAAAPQ